MAAKPENERVVNPIIAWIKAQGGDAYHVHGGMFQRKGEPDIDGWLPHLLKPGQFVHVKVEAKYGKNKPEPLQDFRLTVYEQAGYMTGVVYSLEAFKTLYVNFCNPKE